MSSTGQLPELESLRSQVADLSRQLAERDRSAQDLWKQSDLLRVIVEGTAAETGEEFFASLVTHLSAVLKVQYAIIGEVQGDRIQKIRTLAVSVGGALADNFEYELAHTPCATALTQTFACFDRGLQAMFPQFQRLADLGAESYCAVPLRAKGGAVMGLLVVMDTKPLEHSDVLQSLLGVFAPRIAAEFERKRADQERVQALANLHDVIETIPDIVFALDTQGNLVKWNRRLEYVTGYSPEELLNKPALAFVPAEERDRTAAAIQQAFTDGYAELDGHLLTKDLRTIPYQWTSALLKSSHGEPIGITGVGRDVSDKKRAEEELKQQRRHLVDAQALAHLGSWVWNIDSGEVQWSDELYRIFGHEPGSIHVTYDMFLASLHPDDHDRVLAAINDAVAGKTPYDIEYRIVRPKGDVVRIVHARGNVSRNATGHPLSMAGTVLDITERMQVEEALRASEERWQLAVQSSNDGIWDGDPRTGRIFFSSRWKTMRGFEDHEIKNHVDEWRSRIHPDDLDRVLRNLDCYLAKQAPEYCEEYRVQRKDGSYMWVSDRGVALWADDGTPTRMVGSESDITERRRAEKERREQELLITLMLSTGPGCMKRVAEDGTLLHMNPAGLKLIEACREEDVLGLSVFNLVVPEHRAAFMEMHRDVINGSARTLQFEIQGLRGARRWMETFVVPFKNPVMGQTEHLAVTHDITERKLAEEARRVSEERLRAIFENAAVGIAVGSHTTGTGIDQVNPAFQSMTGYTSEELCRLGMKGLTYPDDIPASKALVERLVSGTLTNASIEKRYVKKDGSIMWAQTTVSSIFDEQGNYENSVAMIQDITGRKVTEQFLAGEKHILEMIATDAPLEEVLAGMCRMVEELSAGALCSILLLDPDGIHLRHGAAPNLPEAYVHAIDGVAIGPTVGSCGTAAFTRRQVVVSNIADDPLWTDYRDLALCHGLGACWSTPVTSSNGSILGTFAVYYRQPQQPSHADLQLVARVTDVACIVIEQKRREEAIREAELRYRTIFKQAGAGVAQIESCTGRFVQVNRQYCEILGLTEAEMLATTVGAVTHPDDLERNFERGARLLSGEIASFTMENRYVHKDGSIVWVNLNVAPLWRLGEIPVHHIAIVLDITERKRAEEALRRSERQLRTVLDALPVGVWFTDQSGKALLANPAAKQIWSGIKQIKIENAADPAGWWEAMGPSSELHRWALSHALTKGIPSLNETLDLECLDGTKKTIRNTTVPIQDEAGVVLGAIVLNEDITILRQAQEALKLTQFSVDHAVEGFFWIGPDARILNVNDRACQMLEYTRDDLTTMTVHDIDPNFPPELWPAHWEELKQKGSMTFETKYWSRTGRVMDTEVTVNYLDYQGREYNCAIMRDIGERKRGEAALRVSEERYRALYDDTPTMYFTLATDGTVRSVNRFGADQLGYLVEELIGHSVLGVFHEEDKELVAASLSVSLATPEKTRQWEFRKVRKDGRIIWVRETVRVGQSPTGETVLLVTCEDITEKKLAEEHQARQYEQLQAIFRMTLALSHATSLDDIYHQAIDCVQRALKADRASILLFDEEGVMRFRASQGLSERYQAAVEGHSPWTDDTVDPQPILIDDVTSDPSIAQYMDIFRAEGLNALGFIPLVLPGGLLGKFMLYYDQPHHFTDEEVGVAQTIAGHVAYMIQRTRADYALRVSEERYRSLVDNAPIGIFVNQAGQFVYANREMQRILNATSPEQLIGTSVFDRIAPEFHTVVKDRIHSLMMGESVPLLDEQFMRLDGSRVDVAVTAIPTSFDGTPVMQVLVLDITGRKDAEAALREKHALLSAIMDATMDIIFVKDLKGRYLHMNLAGARAAGIPAEEVVGKDDDAIWPADLAAAGKAADRQIITSGAALTMEESTTAGGTRITYLTTKVPYRDAAGRLIGIIGVAHDITQIKRSEEELRRSHDFLRQVIDIDPNFIFAKDRARRFTLVNKAVADAYGTTVDELIGKTDADFNANPDEVEFFWQKDFEVMDSLQERFIPEEVITDSTGKTRWLQTVKRPILDEQGRAIMVLGAATDITDRKRIEEVLRQRERDLHIAIEERERISQDLHDGILQSLFAIGLTLETTKSMMPLRTRKTSGPPLDQAIAQLNRVMHEIRNFIAGLGSDLLQGKDLPTALQHMLKSLTQNQAMRVRLAVEDRAAQAVSAEQSLHMLLVIQEAVSNCIRHGRAEEATVSLKMLKQGVRLSISDNGRGFNPKAAKGIGHGLANMTARAKKIGARVTVMSKVNEGTRIVLDLPKEASVVPR